MSKRIGEASVEQLFKETIKAGLKLKAVKAFMLKPINENPTVQQKKFFLLPIPGCMTDPDSGWLIRPIKRGIDIRQNCQQKSMQLFAHQNLYTQARQMKLAKKGTRKLRAYLGRINRDIERKCPKPDLAPGQLSDISAMVYRQKRVDTVCLPRKLNASVKARPTT